ncbi:MAG: ABC transporter substrate-binding protein [Candidatus Omnitrophota bacterium]|jgi:1,4-dihydroxy-6-naphthoate synthase|nr:MAG: ABC transporter substrate-binding protein [Candidatus Omnitrophota bacterium]
MNPREILLGHSPDSDDAFMFYALAKNKIDTGELEFRHILQDIETLNHRAALGELDVTAISVHAYPYVKEQYALLTAGGSMGDGYGPMVVAREAMSLEELKTKTIAIPGKKTSAYLALRLCLGEFSFDVVPFDQILPAVLHERVDAGLIIHEGQLLYHRQGLHKIVDLGEWWAGETGGLPLPLGANAIRKDLGDDIIARIAPLMRQTIEYSLNHREEALEHALQYARDLPKESADRFVGMYVNELTLHLGERGKQAYRLFLEKGYESGIIPYPCDPEFVECG